MPTTTRTSSDPLLSAVRTHRDAEAHEQVATLTAVLDWAAANTAEPTEVDHILAQVEMPLHLAGPGAPMVGEWAAMDLALSLGMTNDAGLGYLGNALELRHRLPRLYARVVRLEVPLWKAFRVAEQTVALPQAGAAAVDTAIAPFLHSCSWAQVDRAVDAARAAHDPEEAERLRLAAAEGLHASVYLGGAGTTGTVEVIATLDTADAIDLEQALRDGAQTLADLGSAETDVVPASSPRQDPWPLVLRHDRARPLHLDQPHRRDLRRRPQTPTTLNAPHPTAGGAVGASVAMPGCIR